MVGIFIKLTLLPGNSKLILDVVYSGVYAVAPSGGGHRVEASTASTTLGVMSASITSMTEVGQGVVESGSGGVVNCVNDGREVGMR
jgi:hypothetical protein